jgi:catechol 2,3-dioxygenase-like lactoylglutathione lyase family enzyme
MPFHHLAVATRDAKATHEFYTRAMGFRLVKVVAGPTPEGGWSKHLFYDTGGGGMIAFWELHGLDLPADWSPALAEGLGLPLWTNHIAFDAPDRSALDAARERWLECGYDVMEIDHEWCVSIYTRDPNGTLVEWCTTTRAFSEDEHREALERLASPNPPFDPTPGQRVYRAKR